MCIIKLTLITSGRENNCTDVTQDVISYLISEDLYKVNVRANFGDIFVLLMFPQTIFVLMHINITVRSYFIDRVNCYSEFRQ